MRVATVLLEQTGEAVDNNTRLDIVSRVAVALRGEPTVILCAAGWLNARTKKPADLFPLVQAKLCSALGDNVACIGIDGRKGRDQIALAISKQGIVAAARKFHPTDYDRSIRIAAADDYLAKEEGFARIFSVGGTKLYLAVCNDVFGLPQRWLENPGVDAVLGLIHGFYPRGQGGSGDVDFARKGLAGASKQWGCPAFASAVFFDRPVPPAWPSGILWNQGEASVRTWKYTDNPLTPDVIDVGIDGVTVRTFGV